MPGYLLSEKDFGRVSRVVRKIEGQTNPALTLPGDSRLLIPQPVSITFYNSTTETIPAGGIMAITGAALADTIPYLTIAKPSATFYRAYAVNGDLQVPTKKFGQCYTSGWCRVAYDTGTPAVSELWGPKAGQWTVSKTMTARGDCGLWIAGITDAANKIALGQIVPRGMAQRCRGKLNGALTSTTASQSVDNIVALDGGWLPVASTGDGVNLTVYNVYTVTGFAGDDNGVCYIVWNETNTRWEFIDAECPA